MGNTDKDKPKIRRIVAIFLHSPEHRNKLYELKDVAAQLSLSAFDIDRIAEVSKVFHSAFAQGQGSRGYECELKYEDIGLSGSEILFARRTRPNSSTPWSVVVGCFTEESLTALKTQEEEGGEAVPVAINIGLEAGSRDELITALKNKLPGDTAASTQSSEGDSKSDSKLQSSQEQRIKELEKL